MQNISCSGLTEVPALHYTPSIEDIFVGYEAELNWCTMSGLIVDLETDEDEIIVSEDTKLWETIVCGYNETVFDSKHTPQQFHNLIKLGRLRTPYLTPIQIEKEGWNSWRGSENVTPFNLFMLWGAYRFEIDGYILIYERRKHSITIYEKKNKTEGDYPNNWDQIYKGLCPSINEFRKIMKLLNIK